MDFDIPNELRIDREVLDRLRQEIRKRDLKRILTFVTECEESNTELARLQQENRLQKVPRVSVILRSHGHKIGSEFFKDFRKYIHTRGEEREREVEEV